MLLYAAVFAYDAMNACLYVCIDRVQQKNNSPVVFCKLLSNCLEFFDEVCNILCSY